MSLIGKYWKEIKKGENFTHGLMLRSSMVALYELFLTVLGRDKLTPAVAELLLLLTSKSEVIITNGQVKMIDKLHC